MDKETTATFIGHKECYGLDEGKLLSAIVGLIDDGYKEFLCGGMGNFDMMCARIVKGLKKAYPHIRCYLVIPYLTFKTSREDYFDEIIYPDGFEKYHFKAAIPKRNKYLIDNSSAAVCYVTHDWGGAAKTVDFARRKNKTIINLGTL